MKKSNSDIENSLRALTVAKDLDESFAVFDDYVKRLGFMGVAYSFIPSLNIHSKKNFPPVFKFSESYNPKFLAEYIERRFDQHDFTIKAIKDQRMRLMDWWEEDHRQLINKEERIVISVARNDYQIKNGISIPTLSDERGIAGASIITEDDGRCYELLKKEQLQSLVLFTQLFHNTVMANPTQTKHFSLPMLEKLSHKEKLVLRYLVSGQPMKRIEKSTGISPRYASNLVGRIREKFGIIDKDQLIYCVGLLNVIEQIK